ncbi:unnamed protein product [Polarella glacialis]|uniref:Uncharacterized protein n=1 Tax=Polarella glacialis TaxID=89957 RepID=A0A813IBI1_POLGL|nr:unnamed protein product [Polarella glacialis]
MFAHTMRVCGVVVSCAMLGSTRGLAESAPRVDAFNLVDGNNHNNDNNNNNDNNSKNNKNNNNNNNNNGACSDPSGCEDSLNLLQSRKNKNKKKNNNSNRIGGGAREEFIPACARSIFDQHEPARLPEAVPGLNRIFILHYPKLTARRARCDQQLAEHGLANSSFFMAVLNKPDLTADILSCLVRPVGQTHTSLGAQSLAIKHLWAYYHCWKGNHQHCLVMEDDFEFKVASMKNSLASLMQETPPDYTTVHVSVCLNMHDFGHVVPRTHLHGPGKSSRCTSGYLVSKHGAELMLRRVFTDLHGITMPADHQQNGVIDTGGYWYEPPMMIQSDLGGVRSYDVALLGSRSNHSSLQCEADGSC